MAHHASRLAFVEALAHTNQYPLLATRKSRQEVYTVHSGTHYRVSSFTKGTQVPGTSYIVASSTAETQK